MIRISTAMCSAFALASVSPTVAVADVIEVGAGTYRTAEADDFLKGRQPFRYFNSVPEVIVAKRRWRGTR